MVIPWGTIKSLLLLFGPLLLPRVIAYYRRFQAAAARQQRQAGHGGGGGGAVEVVRPLRMRTAVVLAVLAAAATASLASAGFFGFSGGLSLLQPENIFVATDSRLQTPTDVLFTRLAARRPGRLLTAADETLRARFASLESRLLYLQYGPDVLVGCSFCAGTGADGGSISAAAYLCYALVDLAAQHLAVLVLVALATSPLVLLGRKGGAASTSAPAAAAAAASDRAYDVAAARVRRWRTPVTAAALVLAAADVALLATHDGRASARATRQSEIDFYFWTARRVRGLAGGLLLGGLAAVLYSGATGSTPPGGQLVRLLVLGTASTELSPAQRVAGAADRLAAARSRLNAAAIVKNTVLRDVELRARTQAYWAREVALVAEAMEERDVIEGVNDALEHRLDMRQIERDADLYVDNVVPLPPGSSSGGGGGGSSGVA